MKSAVLVLGLMLFGCGLAEEMPPDESGQAAESSVDELALCSSEGGTCRKSRCRAGEESNWDLECGTDAQCCVPIESVEAQATCRSAGGTCRKSRCRDGEESNWDLECGTDAQCCVPVQ
jgi:hypothetical protein